MKIAKIGFGWFLSGAALLFACSTTPADPPTPVTIVIPVTATPPPSEVLPTPAPETVRSEEEAEAWREDLAFFRTRLEEIHPDPFYRVAAQVYDLELEALLEQLGSRTDTEVTVGLARIVAFIDGHSAISMLDAPVNFHLYPLRLYLFEDGLYVIEADPDLQDFVGGRVLKIGHLTTEEALAAVAPYVPHDNPSTIALLAPNWLVRAEVLAAIGIIDSLDAPGFVIEMPDGSTRTLDMAPITLENYRERSNIARLAGLPEVAEPLYLSRRYSDSYWFTYLEDSGTLYIQYNQVRGGIGSMVREIRDFLETTEIERVVVDLRHNPGGDNTTYGPMLELLSEHPAVNRPGRFFTIIGRQTFSAATNFATELENITHTLFVGEPTGGSPNLFGDTRPVRLPNSGILINISARYWEISTPEDDRVWIEPDLPVALTFGDFSAGRDPALEAILTFDPRALFHPAFNPVLAPSAMAAWERADIRDPFIVEHEGTLYLFYAGKDDSGASAIGLATSQNGRKWFRSSANPILTGKGAGFDGFGVEAPVIDVTDGVWTLYYAGVETASARPAAIGRASAPAPTGPWELSSEPVITAGLGQAWDSLSITPGAIVRLEDGWRLYYSGFSAAGQIGIGSADSSAEQIWDKFDDPGTTGAAFADSDPVLAGAGPGSWDEIVWAPYVLQENGQWTLWYHGDPISSRNSLEIGIGMATSADGLQWLRPTTPLFTLDAEGRFPHTPFSMTIGDYEFIYFASVEDGGTGGQIEYRVRRR